MLAARRLRGKLGCMRTLAASLVLVVVASCASFTTRLPDDETPAQRAALAGQTLRCAGDARRHALYLAGAAALTSWGSSAAAAAAAAAEPELEPVLLAAGCGLGITSLVATVAALVRVYDSTSYDRRAGELAAELSDVGCADDPLPQ